MEASLCLGMKRNISNNFSSEVSATNVSKWDLRCSHFSELFFDIGNFSTPYLVNFALNIPLSVILEFRTLKCQISKLIISHFLIVSMFVKSENQTSLTSGHLFRADSSLIEDLTPATMTSIFISYYRCFRLMHN